jgi:hypothetical protein
MDTQENKTEEESKKESSAANNNEPQINFSSFLMGLATQTMVCLGEIPDPTTNKKDKNLPIARQTIDVLSLLEEKTKGNLTQDETMLFTEILSSLKLTYVKSIKNQ